MAVLAMSLLLLLSSCAALARMGYRPCTEPVEVRFPSGPTSPLLVPETLSNGKQVVRVLVRFSRPVLVGFFSDFGRFDEWAGRFRRHVGRLPPISFVGDLASGDEVWEPISQSYMGSSNDMVEVVFEVLSGPKVKEIFFRPFHLLIAPHTIRSVARGKGNERIFVPVPAMVLGRYYMSHQRLLDTDYAETIQLANPSLYCRQYPYRPAIQQGPRTERTELVNIQLAEDDAKLEITEHGSTKVHLPISIGGQGTGSFPLPKVVKATFGAQVVTVKLPNAQLEVECKGRILHIPLSMVTISEQRERAFHQQPRNPPYHTCWSGRRNNLSFLPVYHVLENSGEFRVYLPEKDPTHWAIVAGGTRARVVQRGGAGHSSSWTGLQLELPHGILSGIQKYAFLWPPPIPPGPVESGVHMLVNEYVDVEASGDLGRAVFVPREQVEQTGCGTLNATYDQFISQKDFCNTPIGSCVGMPLFSTKRFPVIPPFGLTELAAPNSTEFGTNETASYLNIQLEARDGLGSISVDECTVLEPSLYQSLHEWASAPASREDLCQSVWHISPNTHTAQQELTATLTASINNFGQGGGNVSFTVKCSKLIDVVPNGGKSFVWTEPGGKAAVTFTLSGSRALSLPLAEHKCHLGVSVVVEEGLPWSAVGKEMPVCPTALRTYHGAFKDPCAEPEQPLPETKVDFHFLPQSELSKNEKRGLQSVAATGHSFVRALTLQLWVPEEEVELVYYLQEMSVDCLSQDILIMDRERLALAESAWEGQQEAAIEYQRDLLSQKRLFFFIKKQADPSAVTGCKVVVLANRPHVACPQPMVVMEKEVILTKADHAAYLEVNRVPLLQALFGDQPSAVLYTLVACAMAIPLLLGGAGVGHLLLFICRKKLPLRGEVGWKREQLKQAKLDEKRRWENPATYLEEGPHGPFYLLHNFRATAPLDSQDLKPVKMAGTLRYKDKELPVMFGHLKQVWVEPSGSTWVQASSGMYLLECKEAAEEYRAEHRALLVRQNPELDHLFPSEGGYHGEDVEQEGVAPGDDNQGDVEQVGVAPGGDNI